MILAIVISAVLLTFMATVVFLLARYAPIIANLFMNITVRRVQNGEVPLAGEHVTFETTDGVRLAGTLGRPPTDGSAAPVVVFCHEFTSNRHSVTKYAWFLEAAGFRVFTFDFRGHGDGDRPRDFLPRPWVTQHEVSDLRAALRYLRDREDVGDVPVGLLGISRGAVAAIAVASEDPSIVGVVADGAFSTDWTLHGYMRRWAPIFVDRRMLLLSSPDWVFSIFRRVGTALAEHRLGVRFVSLLPVLRRLKTPVFLIHGKKDGYIEAGQAGLLYELAGGPKDLWIVPKADHNQAVDVSPAEYSRRVVHFFQTFLGVTAPAVATVSRSAPS